MPSRRWLGTIAFAFILALTACAGHAPGPRELPDTTPRTLTIATWNLEWLNRDIGGGKVPRSAQDYERLAAYARRLDADIVALQEIDGKEAAFRVFDPATYDIVVTSDDGYLQRTGFAYKKWVQVTPQPDVQSLAIGYTRRGADIMVRVGALSFRLLSIHLKTGCWEDPLKTNSHSCEILNAQLTALKEWVDSRTREGVAFAVLGDFNRRFTVTDRFFPELDAGIPADAQLYDAAQSHRSECWKGEFPVYIDHLVFSHGLGEWILPNSFHQVVFDPSDAPHKSQLSDHCPITVTLRLGGQP
jgi:endonuclease/exonuclease/phosphatase family metal-dependent hydrolase